jgi:hypothetical protein
MVQVMVLYMSKWLPLRALLAYHRLRPEIDGRDWLGPFRDGSDSVQVLDDNIHSERAHSHVR